MAPVPAKERDRTISMAAEEEIMSILKERLKEITNKTPQEKQEVDKLLINNMVIIILQCRNTTFLELQLLNNIVHYYPHYSTVKSNM